MKPSHTSKWLMRASGAIMIICAGIGLLYIATSRGECTDQAVNGKTERVCVRNAQFR